MQRGESADKKGHNAEAEDRFSSVIYVRARGEDERLMPPTGYADGPSHELLLLLHPRTIKTLSLSRVREPERGAIAINHFSYVNLLSVYIYIHTFPENMISAVISAYIFFEVI